MSNLRINIRFLYWHLECTFDWRWSIGYNEAHFPIPKPRAWKIIEVYEFDWSDQ